ncbi:MAG: ATP-binding cassette domain-containing protein, partial [Parasutterella excrementihominis]|uniref:ATP-binding cassette domain-containing protein n=1 Tax=Parasutterella excrementihominis TaxID=487175 RepID=UPI003994E67B
MSERIAILGRSGAGKSTLAKALAGLLKPESGYIKFGKRVLFDSSTGIHLPPQKRGVGFAFQN